ncbi:MAG TPA: hypothetical protein DCL38_03625 [Lachnospiraceae bacterium]|nr:hypothetical protein [Lachnospiraceae bacterium]
MGKHHSRNRNISKRLTALGLLTVLLITSLTGCTVTYDTEAEAPGKETQEAHMPSEDGDKETEESTTEEKAEVLLSKRPSLLSEYMNISFESISPKLEPYEVKEDLSNVINADQFYLQEGAKEKLARNSFVVLEWGGDEFFDVYEPNRYDYIPNFITVDSMLHTYHLYFAYLLKRTEKNELSAMAEALSREMLEEAKGQYEALKGTEWEKAAVTDMAFFAVPLLMFDENADIPQEVREAAQSEAELILNAGGIDKSPVFGFEEDYSQYKPRGYYDTDETLSRYFRAMMWYGRIGFRQDKEELDRSALLISLMLDGERLEKWERIYSVTSFVAGTSDDNGYYEYRPVISSVYGEEVKASDLAGDEERFKEYHRLTGELPKPQINSVPVFESDSDEEVEKKNFGFRFMGQRFTLDEAVFSRLVFRAVKENSLGEKRMLPDALDVAAALGSNEAVEILREQGNMDYEGYEANLKELQDVLKDAPESTWETSLYSGWLNMIRPLLQSKGEGYPSFMQSREWDRKSLSSFLGSYTELKHDTILYAKQIMAEMGDGGEEPEVRDDRGYVEPEPEVFARLKGLAEATLAGYDAYGLLDDETRADLKKLSELAGMLQVMSEKELKGELLSDDEYELIRDYGGQIEHFWQVAYRDEAENEYFSSYEFPAALVADIATDPNGSVLEVANGNPVTILVVIEVDGKLKIAEGAVSSFYEFPFGQRLTDSEWKKIMGYEWDEEGSLYEQYHDTIRLPEWTDNYRHEYDYDEEL